MPLPSTAQPPRWRATLAAFLALGLIFLGLPAASAFAAAGDGEQRLVTYKYVSDTPGMEVPPQLTPPATGFSDDGTVLTPPADSRSPYDAGIGVWTFKGWDPPTATVDGEPLTFTGTWSYVPTYYQVTYLAESTDPSLTIPQAVLDVMPASFSSPNKSNFLAPQPTATAVSVPGGTWRFERIQPMWVTVDGADFTASYAWGYVADPAPETSLVQFTYLTDPGSEANQAVPDALQAQAPQSYSAAVGSTVTPPDSPAVGDTYPTEDGTWTFLGWTENSLQVEAMKSNFFYGNWTYKKAPTYTATTSPVSITPGRDFPANLVEGLTATQTDLRAGQTVTPSVPNVTAIAVDGGTWTLAGYDQVSQVVSDANLTFRSQWEFSETAPEMKDVTYSFTSGTDGQELPAAVTDLLPKTSTAAVDAEVTAPTPSSSKVSTSEGTWTFAGWDPASAKVTADGAHFTGTWTFEAKAEPTDTPTPTATPTPSDSSSPSPSASSTSTDTPAPSSGSGTPTATATNPTAAAGNGDPTTAQPGNGLASTGFNPTWLLAGVAVLMLVGAAALVTSRRRHG